MGQLESVRSCGTPGRRALKEKIGRHLYLICTTWDITWYWLFTQCPDFWLFLDLCLLSLSLAPWYRRGQAGKRRHRKKGNENVRLRLTSGKISCYQLYVDNSGCAHSAEGSNPSGFTRPSHSQLPETFGIIASGCQLTRAMNIAIVYRLNK